MQSETLEKETFVTILLSYGFWGMIILNLDKKLEILSPETFNYSMMNVAMFTIAVCIFTGIMVGILYTTSQIMQDRVFANISIGFVLAILTNLYFWLDIAFPEYKLGAQWSATLLTVCISILASLIGDKIVKFSRKQSLIIS